MPLIWTGLLLKNRGLLQAYSEVWTHGELLLISVAIGGTSIGDLIASGQRLQPFKLIAGGIALTLLLIAGGWYADIAASLMSGTYYDLSFVAVGSPYVFVSCLIVSLMCTIVTKEFEP